EEVFELDAIREADPQSLVRPLHQLSAYERLDVVVGGRIETRFRGSFAVFDDAPVDLVPADPGDMIHDGDVRPGRAVFSNDQAVAVAGLAGGSPGRERNEIERFDAGQVPAVPVVAAPGMANDLRFGGRRNLGPVALMHLRGNSPIIADEAIAIEAEM